VQLHELTITKAHEGLEKKEFSVLELTKSFLKRIEETNKKISAFLTIRGEKALLEAKKIDDSITAGRKISPLSGIPLAIKDNILTEGIRTTCASKILENYIAPYSATCVNKLKGLGAIILGKTNLDEFAMGASTENSAFFPTKNPYDLTRVAGGSSGGSAAAVANNMCAYALGSDTGGSIRQPASFCGVVGLKPTYGAVSRYGLVAFASSFDQIGPITKTVDDAKLVFKAISGKDELDSTSLELPELWENKININLAKSGIRAGVPKEYFVKGIDPGVEDVIKKAIKKFEELGIEIEEISLPHTEYALPAYYLIATSEASANLARYDGIKYGYSQSTADQQKDRKVKSLLDIYLESRGDGFGSEVKRRIMLGTYALSAGYYDAYYLKAEKIRTLIKEDFDKAFQKVDIIFTPTSPTPAFKIGEKINDPLSMYLSDIFTVSANLVGLPAISLPVGFTDKPASSQGGPALQQGGLPVGLQIIGRPFEENTILEVARQG